MSFYPLALRGVTVFLFPFALFGIAINRFISASCLEELVFTVENRCTLESLLYSRSLRPNLRLDSFGKRGWTGLARVSTDWRLSRQRDTPCVMPYGNDNLHWTLSSTSGVMRCPPRKFYSLYYPTDSLFKGKSIHSWVRPFIGTSLSFILHSFRSRGHEHASIFFHGDKHVYSAAVMLLKKYPFTGLSFSHSPIHFLYCYLKQKILLSKRRISSRFQSKGRKRFAFISRIRRCNKRYV